MKILITGAAGFIGYHLTNFLSDKGYRITAIDNLNDFYETKLKILRVGNFNKNVNFYKLSLNELNSIKGNFDLAINLAAQAGTRVTKDLERNYYQSNILGFQHFMDYCNYKSIKKIIYASSSSVYDDEDGLPFSEENSILKPKTFYGMSKKMNEDNAQSNFQLMDAAIIGLRFFSVYGPFGRPDMAYFKFTRLINNHSNISLHNRGEMYRDMTYIDDIVNGINNAVDYIKNINVPTHEIFNLGNNCPIQTYELLKKIEKKLNKRAKINYITTSNEAKYTHSDLKKSKSILKYSPQIAIDDGIDEFIKWYRNYE